MILKLDDGSELELGDELNRDQRLLIMPDDMPGTPGPGCSVCVNRSEAQKIIDHLRAVFDLT